MPDRWQSKTVGELCTFSSGHGFGPNDWASDGLPIIRIQNLNGSREFHYFSGEPDPSWVVEPGELLFAWAGVQGVSFGATEWPGPRAVLNQHIYRIRSRGAVEQAWLRLVLDEVTHRIERRAHGFKANLVHVRKSDITEQQVPVPPKDERTEIIAIDDQTTARTRLMDKLIEEKRKMLVALMQQLLTGNRRLSARPNCGTKHDLILGEVPADWEVAPIGEVTKRVTRRNIVGETHVLTASGQYGLVDQREFFNRAVAGQDLSKYYLLQQGEFAYNRSRMKGYTYGAIKRLDRYPRGAISTLYLCFAIADKRVDSDFLRWYCEGGQMNRQLFRVTPVGGRAHGLLNLTSDDFFSIRVMLPPANEQRAIAAVLDTAQHEIDLLKQLRDQIQQQKRGLMQKLLTGQVPVKGA